MTKWKVFIVKQHYVKGTSVFFPFHNGRQLHVQNYMEQGNQSYACSTPSFQCNWNLNKRIFWMQSESKWKECIGWEAFRLDNCSTLHRNSNTNTNPNTNTNVNQIQIYLCNLNVNGKNALVEKPPSQPRINMSVKYVSSYTKLQYVVRNYKVKFIQINVQNIQCTL